MPRPTKRRCICAKPSVTLFEPVGGRDEVITIGYDEFEVMRLLDYEAYSQEQCARKMQVSRPTVTRMYDHARRQVVRALVEGKKLQIHGGDVIVCTKLKPECAGAKHCCHRPQKGEETMKKIAVPVENGQVFGHFGKSRAFLLSDTDHGAVLDQKVLPVTGEGHGALAGLLKKRRGTGAVVRRHRARGPAGSERSGHHGTGRGERRRESGRVGVPGGHPCFGARGYLPPPRGRPHLRSSRRRARLCP